MKINKTKKRAFTLIETLVVIGVMALISIGVIQQIKQRTEQNRAVAAGERIKEVGNALQSYVSDNKQTLLANIPAGTTQTIDGICILNDSLPCVPGGLPVAEILPKSFSDNSLLGTGYKIALKNVDNKQISGLVYTDQAVTLAGTDSEPRYDLLGYAARAAGNAVGFSGSAGDQIDGLNGGWSVKNADMPYGGVAGLLAYRTNGVDDYDGTYLRRDGSNEMTGNLLLGNNDIKNVNSLTADNYVVSQNAYFQNMRSQHIYNSGDIYTDSLNATYGYFNVATTSKDLISGQYVQLGAGVTKNTTCGDTVNPIGVNIPVPNGTLARAIDGTGEILSCQGGIWKVISGTPAGAYLYFNSLTCPDGWVSANGTNGTVDLRGNFIRGVGGNSAPLGVQQGDAIRNITGGITGQDYDSGGFGAFYQTYDGGGWNPEGSWDSDRRTVRFDASRQVPTAAENRPVNVALMPCMKAG